MESRSAYTAFGERVSLGGSPPPSVSSRYRYAGEWGYEEGLLRLDGFPGTAPIVLAHVGERWYDAGTGRFVQRDPIGVMGGINVYLYCNVMPIGLVDPSGMFWREVGLTLVGAGIAVAATLVVGPLIVGAGVAIAAETILGAAVVGGVIGAVAGGTAKDARQAFFRGLGVGATSICTAPFAVTSSAALWFGAAGLLNWGLNASPLPQDMKDIGDGILTAAGTGPPIRGLGKTFLGPDAAKYLN